MSGEKKGKCISIIVDGCPRDLSEKRDEKGIFFILQLYSSYSYLFFSSSSGMRSKVMQSSGRRRLHHHVMCARVVSGGAAPLPGRRAAGSGGPLPVWR